MDKGRHHERDGKRLITPPAQVLTPNPCCRDSHSVTWAPFQVLRLGTSGPASGVPQVEKKVRLLLHLQIYINHGNIVLLCFQSMGEGWPRRRRPLPQEERFAQVEKKVRRTAS